jgi:hypothetical protein
MRLSLFLVNSIGNFLLGLFFIVFPTNLVNFLGLPNVNQTFYTGVLGAPLIGIGIALLLEGFHEAIRTPGLGLGGAVVINLCLSLALTRWLIWGNLSLSLTGTVILWTLVAFFVGISLLEFWLLRKEKARKTSKQLKAEQEKRMRRAAFLKSIFSSIRQQFSFLKDHRVAATLFVILGIAFMIGELKLLQAIILWFFSFLTLQFVRRFLDEVKPGKALSFESHWGGLGGGLGGWRMAAPLVFLLAALAFGLLMIIFVSSSFQSVNIPSPTLTPTQANTLTETPPATTPASSTIVPAQSPTPPDLATTTPPGGAPP